MAVTTTGKDKIITGTRVYVGGYDLSGDARTFSALDNTFNIADIWGMSEDLTNYLADSRMAGVQGFQALMNDTAAQAWGQLKAPGSNTGSQISICFGGGGAAPAVGDPAYHIPSIQFNAPVNIQDNAIAFTADFMPDGGQVDTNTRNPLGVCLRGPTSLSATLAASSTNSHDNEVSSANGFTAVIHVITTASGNFAFKLRHSSDDSAWSDLGSFSVDGSAVASEFITGSGIVNQYVAFDAQRTGGSCTVIVTFTRN